MTEEEKEIILNLGMIWSSFLNLPRDHPQEEEEFLRIIHQAQNLVAARAGFRELNNNL